MDHAVFRLRINFLDVDGNQALFQLDRRVYNVPGLKAVLDGEMFRGKDFPQQVFQKDFPHAAAQFGRAQDVLQAAETSFTMD